MEGKVRRFEILTAHTFDLEEVTMDIFRTTAPRQSKGGDSDRRPEVVPGSIAAQPAADSGNGSKQQLLYEDILAPCPQAILVLDRECRVLFSNAKAAEMVGKPPEYLLGRSVGEWSEFASKELQDACHRAVDEQQPLTFEYRGEGGAWFEVQLRPCQAGMAVFFLDISDRKQAEIAAEEREAELRDFLENATMALHWVGPDGTILWANDAELRLLGYTREEYLGHNITEFHVDQPVINDILCRLANNEELHSYESRLRCKDGTIRHVAINSNVYFRNGEFVHTRCFTRDITKEKIAAELQQRLAAIVESSDDAIISKDLNGTIRSWNLGAERLFGYKEEETLGKHISMLAPPDVVDEIPTYLERLSRGERIDHYLTKRRTKDGRILSISLTISPIRDASGKIIGASKVARDLTEIERSHAAIKLANEALSRSNADLEQFAYSASHDLQEPLRMVATYSEMLAEKFGAQLGAAGQQYLGYVLEGALRMEQLLHDLRTFTQVSTAAAEPTAPADAAQSLQRSLATLSTTLEANSASVTHSELPVVLVHEFQLDQLFQNLIGNAVRYRTEQPPQVHVSAERDGNMWIFSVRDNGIGIDPQYKEQIFGIFKRLHTSAEYPGTGMGLAICQRIVERAGGRIWVESEPGRGSTFFFTLPAARS